MRFGLNKSELVEICTVFKGVGAIEEVILFGSRATGNYKPGSDIDLALKGRDLNLRMMNTINSELDDLNLPYTFDLCNFNEIKNPELVKHIQTAGALFYANDETAVSDQA
ncbi:nucleotidyltransferase domain-containing protein [Segetibacter sp. 3557_3]|uniref:nucleotidyltransferase domain-containing protein n=1 Tax=Segetibacter sp. 3557_3 TaxID=2547429 RepID=UPI001058E3C1|nr:nucleotidyltransferase domain-containing protein [Segetibacter sp. 3557_3]TDH24592.1 nucleotidyltransferase domain-containing protein [Segetibacter sp. 3557_3]